MTLSVLLNQARRKLHIELPHDLYSSSKNVITIRQKRMRLRGHVACRTVMRSA
jgi:hypothetical protein